MVDRTEFRDPALILLQVVHNAPVTAGCPTKPSFWVASIGAACSRCGNSDAAKPAKARENCVSWEISRRLRQPQMRRKEGPLSRRYSNSRVWLML